jgi:hypothetical protein
MSGRSETMQLVNQLRKDGLVVERTGSGHWKVTRPGHKGMVILAFSPRKRGNMKTMKRLEQELGWKP